MDEEKTLDVSTEKPEEKNYIDAIKHLKETTVDKSEYNRLLDENKKLLDTMLSSKPVEPEKPKSGPTIDELRKQLYVDDCSNMSNLEYVSKTLQLRDAIIQQDGPEADPFVGRGEKLVPTQQDYEAAQHVADIFKECIESADGDSEMFTAELMRRTKDISPMIRKKS